MAESARFKLTKILVKMNITRTFNERNNERNKTDTTPPSPTHSLPGNEEQQSDPDSKSESNSDSNPESKSQSNPDSDGKDNISFTESQVSYLLSNPFDPSYYAYFACEDLATGKLSEIDLVRYFNLQEWISVHEPRIFQETWNARGVNEISDSREGETEGSNWGKGCLAALEALKKIKRERDETGGGKRGLVRERRWGRVREGMMRRRRDRVVMRNRQLVMEKGQDGGKMAGEVGEAGSSVWSLVRSRLLVLGFILLLLAIHGFWNDHNTLNEVFGFQDWIDTGNELYMGVVERFDEWK